MANDACILLSGKSQALVRSKECSLGTFSVRQDSKKKKGVSDTKL